MALKPMINEPAEPEGPSQEELLAQEREERSRIEQEMRERQAAYDARLEEMERGIARAAQPKPQMTAQQAQQELGLSAEEIQKNPDKALKALEDHIRQAATRDIESRYAPVVQGLAQHAFQSELRSLESRKYWKQAQKDVERYFKDHPQEAMTPGRASEVYKYLVGENIEKYEAAASETREAEIEEKDRGHSAGRPSHAPPAYDVPIRQRAYAPKADKANEKEPSLTDQEELVRQTYNRLGANISKREWVEISKGNVFPKARGADWERGWYADDRRVTRPEE